MWVEESRGWLVKFGRKMLAGGAEAKPLRDPRKGAAKVSEVGGGSESEARRLSGMGKESRRGKRSGKEQTRTGLRQSD